MIGLLLSTLVWFTLAHDRTALRDPSRPPRPEQTTEPWSHRWAAVKKPAREASKALPRQSAVRRHVREKRKKEAGEETGAAGVGDLPFLDQDSTAPLPHLTEEDRKQIFKAKPYDIDSADQHRRTVPVVDGQEGALFFSSFRRGSPVRSLEKRCNMKLGLVVEVAEQFGLGTDRIILAGIICFTALGVGSFVKFSSAIG